MENMSNSKVSVLIENEKGPVTNKNEKGSIIKLVEGVLSSASKLTKTGICIYDLKSFFVSEPEFMLNVRLKGHYCSFCQAFRELPGGKKACSESDFYDLVNTINNYGKPFFHTCHAGLTEIVIPVYYQETIIAVIFIGQCRLKEETKQDAVMANVEKFGGDIGVFEVYFNELPVIDRTELMASAMLVDLSMKYIIENSKKEEIDAYLKYCNYDFIGRAINYINNYYMGAITAKYVVNYIHMNQSYLSRVFKKHTGKSITEYINCLRVEKSKVLLANSSIPVGNISLKVGFTNQNYFTRIFKKYVGMSPRDYRNNSKRQGAQEN